MTMTKFLLFSCLLALIYTSPAQAEKADSLQPLRISAESQNYDGTKKLTTYIGAVHVTKGTLTINANRVELTEDAGGHQYATLYGTPEKLVNYRQKRDGGPDLWAEGQAERIEYNDNLELVKLYSKAKLTLSEGKRPTHESSGAFISYDSRADFISVTNTVGGSSTPGGGNTNAVIYPKLESKHDQ
jgi:lipopolysaccharide export system protein LptA